MNQKLYRLRKLLMYLLPCAIGVVLILHTLNDNILFFVTPKDLYKIEDTSKEFRIGGVVQNIKRNGLDVDFIITDFQKSLHVRYTGITPDLFKESQGVVAKGRLQKDAEHNVFFATELLAKHDENYMPPEVGRALLETVHE